MDLIVIERYVLATQLRLSQHVPTISVLLLSHSLIIKLENYVVNTECSGTHTPFGIRHVSRWMHKPTEQIVLKKIWKMLI